MALCLRAKTCYDMTARRIVCGRSWKSIFPILEERANLQKPCRLYTAVYRLICKLVQFTEQGQEWFSVNAGLVSLNILYILKFIARKFGISLQTQDLWDLIRVHDPPNWQFKHLVLLRAHGLTNCHKLTSYGESCGGATEGSNHIGMFPQWPPWMPEHANQLRFSKSYVSL